MTRIDETLQGNLSGGQFRFARVNMGGLPIAVLDRVTTAKLTITAALSRRGMDQPCLFFTTANGQVMSLCASRPDLKELFQEADVVSADGMSVVFASRLKAQLRLPERVATTDAFHDAAALACREGASFFFLGAREDVNASAVARVRELYPRLTIAGRRNGYFREQDEPELVEIINEAAPDVLWVGLGVPRQQQFILANRHRLTAVGVAKSCGGLFDFLAGKAKRAPYSMQVMGLEWLYRAWLEPRRLAWRYLSTNPHAVYVLFFPPAKAMTDGAIRIDGVF